MIYLIETYWLWTLLALVLGAVIGWLSWERRADEPWLPGWLKWGCAVWLIGLAVALLRWFGGRSGLLLETALLFFVAYLAGCVVGAWLRGRLGGEERPAEPAAEPVTTAPALATVTPITAAPRATVTPIAPAATAVAAPVGEDGHPGARPVGLAGPRGGKADDLKRIKGIGPQNEGRLHGLGIWHFDQIAAWTQANVDWVGAFLAFPGRIEREDWVSQAKQLAQGVETAFSKRVDAGLVESSKDDGSKGRRNIDKPG
ncbi:hypothetical protein [Inquilinus sp. CA228]|uniref:hypothetical protein n=1 Tax=Inquilinus sp. CA228 TaxID=3455609 RepID=UPI003F8D3C0D